MAIFNSYVKLPEGIPSGNFNGENPVMVGECMAQNGPEGQHVLVPNQRHRTRRTYRGMQPANCGNMWENRDTYEPSGLVA